MSGPPRVALLSHLASREAPTGAERSLALLAAGLRRRDWDVRVAVPGPWALAGETRAAGVPVDEIPVRACWLAYPDRRPAVESWARWLRFAAPDPGRARLRAWIRRQAPGVIHVNCMPHVAGAAAGFAAGIPVVWHLREIVPAGPRRRWLARRLARHAARIVAVSEAVGAWVRREGLGSRLEVIPNGVEPPASIPGRDEARRAIGVPIDGYLVGLYGQLRPHKGALEFVRAARAALARAPSLRFVVAGPGPEPYVRGVREAAGGGGEASRIHVLPPRPDADLLLAAADAVCLTTLTPDPFPRSVLEAMSRGRPVVAWTGGGVAEMVRDGETGILVEVGDEEGLTDAFARLATDPELGRTLGAAGRRRVDESFTLALHVDRMAEVLARTAGRS